MGRIFARTSLLAIAAFFLALPTQAQTDRVIRSGGFGNTASVVRSAVHTSAPPSVPVYGGLRLLKQMR